MCETTKFAENLVVGDWFVGPGGADFSVISVDLPWKGDRVKVLATPAGQWNVVSLSLSRESTVVVKTCGVPKKHN